MADRLSAAPQHPTAAGPSGLPAIPFHDLGDQGPPALLDRAPGELQAIVAGGREHYGDVLLRIGDAVSRRWLARTDNPYGAEIAAVAARSPGPGAWLLNLSYEWTCTAGVGPDPGGRGARLLRTLDWPLAGLGRHVVVVRRDTAAGPVCEVTWPGFVGVLTAMAPGRFSAAINQPQFRRWTPSCRLDWAVTRPQTWRSRALPPSHLLRQVSETCRTAAAAQATPAEPPIAAPASFTLAAFFTLAGADGDGWVIERTETRAAVHAAPASIANHWRAIDLPGRDRGTDSRGRQALMDRLRDRVPDGFSWVSEPILNWKTRLAVVANAASGRLLVRGYEADGPATAAFTLPEPRPAGRADTSRAPSPAA